MPIPISPLRAATTAAAALLYASCATDLQSEKTSLAATVDAGCDTVGRPEPDESTCDPHLDYTLGASPKTYWVSPTGIDSGNDEGSQDRPFLTLGRAQEIIRNRARPSGAIVVNVRRGTYVLAGGLQFTPADSGIAEPDASIHRKMVIWRSYDGPGAARLLGGAKLTGWTGRAGGEYSVPLDYEPDALFENGVPARKARFPNYQYDSNFPASQGTYLTATDAHNRVGDGYPWISAAAPGLPDSSLLTNATVFLWPEGNKNINTKEAPVRVSGTNPRRFDVLDYDITVRGRAEEPSNDSVDVRFFVQGAHALLDAPGEYFYDRAARRLHYRPYDTTMASAPEIVAPSTGRIISFIGARGATEVDQVHDIAFEGFAVENAATKLESDEDEDDHEDGEKVHQASIYLEYTKNVIIRNVHVRGSRGHGIALFKWAKHNQIDRAWIEQVGGDGVFLGIDKGGNDAVHCNLVTDTRIHDVGQRQGDSGGIWMGNVSRNKLQRGLIYRSPRYAIVFKPRFGHLTGDSPWLQRYTYGNTIRRYDIRDVMQDSADGGALTYTHFGFFSVGGNTPTSWPPNENLRNYFRDIYVRDVYEHPTSRDQFPPTCIHHDGDASGQSYTSVICERIFFDEAPHNPGCGSAANHESCHVNHNATCAFAMSGNSWSNTRPYDNLASRPPIPTDIGLSDAFPVFEDVFPYSMLHETFDTQWSRNWRRTGPAPRIFGQTLAIDDDATTQPTALVYPLEAPVRKLAVRARFRASLDAAGTILRVNHANNVAAAHLKIDRGRFYYKAPANTAGADIELGALTANQWYELRLTFAFGSPSAISVQLGTAAPRALPVYDASALTAIELGSAGTGALGWDSLDATTSALPPAPSPQ